MNSHSKPKKVFIVVESELRWRFFLRMNSALLELGYEPIYITICLLAYKRGKKLGYNIHLVKKLVDTEEILNNRESLEYKLNEIDKVCNDKMIRKFIENFRRLGNVYNPQYIFIYNGTTIFPLSASEYAKEQNIKTVFFELANIPDKMFVDKEGTNAFSELYRNPSILDDLYVNDNEYECWYSDYKEKKRIVKQANFGKDRLSDFIDFAIDKIYFCIYIEGCLNKINFLKAYLKRIVHKYAYNSNKILQSYKFSDTELQHEKYILLPLQVSKDSQILFHSDVNISESIEYAKERARQRNCKLYIKPHPAEVDNRIISKLDQDDDDNVIIVYGDIKPLISHAEEIIVINSTAGLEAIMERKKIIFLGRSFYKYFLESESRLKKYIMRYLVDINYFSTNPISKEAINKCLQR